MSEYIQGLVSIVIPTYKQSDLLERAIKSVLVQTYSNLELLVVNDNDPEDDYTEIIKRKITSISDVRLKLIMQEKHINGAAARNTGIRVAIGEYIAFLDDDDYWDKRKIELQVEVLESLDQSWGGVACKNIAMKNGKVFRALPSFKEGNICERILLRRTEISTDCIMLRRKALDCTGYFDENLKRNQEVQLLTFFTQKYKMKLLDRYLVCVDSSQSPNQPSPQKMEKIKEDYFKSIEAVLKEFPPSIQERTKIMHKFEIGVLMLRNGMKFEGLKRCLSVFSSPFTLFYSLEYVNRKIKASWTARRMNNVNITEVILHE